MRFRWTLAKVIPIKTLIADWGRDYTPQKSSLILAHLRRGVRMLNELARAALIERGIIGKGFRFQTEQGARNFAAGDQIVFLRNENSLGLNNGMIGRGESRPHRCGNPATNGAGSRSLRHFIAISITAMRRQSTSRTARPSTGKVLASLSLDKHLAYVAMTRLREDVVLYCGRRSFEKAGGLIPLLSRRNVKEKTLDYAGSGEYLDALRYAMNRGLHAVRVARTLLDDQLRLVVRTREKVARLGAKLAVFALCIGLRSVPHATAPTASQSPILHPASAFSASDKVAEPLLRGALMSNLSVTAPTTAASPKSSRASLRRSLSGRLQRSTVTQH